MKQEIKIYRGFVGTKNPLTKRYCQTNITTFNGDLGVINSTASNTYHVVLAVNMGASDLNGFTITKGYALSPQSSVTVNDSVVEKHNGADIYKTNSATKLYNCTTGRNNA